MNAPTTAVANDPNIAMDLNIVGQSPHVFAYRFWHRAPDASDWKEFALGDTEDDIPDICGRTYVEITASFTHVVIEPSNTDVNPCS